MDRLKRLLRYLRDLIRPKLLWSFFVMLVLVAGVTINFAATRQRQNQNTARLHKLSQQQKAKASTSLKADSTAQTKSDVFTDISQGSFQAPTCDRLKNRPGIIIVSSDCQYRLRAFGKITMAVVFVYDSHYNTNDYNALMGSASNSSSLAYINTYLANQAKRYKIVDPAQISITYFGPYKTTEPVDNLYYRDNGYQLLQVFSETSQNNTVPENKYDLIQYVLLDPVYGGVAFPGEHRAFTENLSTVPTFIHESLHLFGASDKYNNNDCDTIGQGDPFGRYNGTISGKDIMCSNFDLSSSTINDITAREIGWTN